MHIPLRKRQADVSSHSSDSLIPHVDNKVALIVGVALAVAAILALLLGGLIKRLRLRRSTSSSESEPSPAETHPQASASASVSARQRSLSQTNRPSNAGSDVTESTLCGDGIGHMDLAKEPNRHVPPPPSIAGKYSQTLVPPFGSRPPSTLPVATTISRHTVKPERSSSWQSIAQRVDEKAGTTESDRMSTAPSLFSVPSSPRTPTSPSSPIRVPSPVSLKDSKRHFYASN